MKGIRKIIKIGVEILCLGKRQHVSCAEKQLEQNKKKNVSTDSKVADKSTNETEYETFPNPVSKNEFDRIMQDEGLSYTYIEFGPYGPGTRNDIDVNGNVLSVRTTDTGMGRSNIKKHVYRTEQEALGAALERMRFCCRVLQRNGGKLANDHKENK